MQVLKKADMIRKNAVESILAERNILISARNPFVVSKSHEFNYFKETQCTCDYIFLLKCDAWWLTGPIFLLLHM